MTPLPRRHLLRAALAAPLLPLAGCALLPQAGDSYLVPLTRLEQSLVGRAPRTYSAAGLVDLQARVQRLRLLPEANRLAAEVSFDAAGPLLPRLMAGTFDLLFALRYEPSDQTLRAHQLQVQSLKLPSLPAGAVGALERAMPALARVALGDDVVLHRLEPRDVQRLAMVGLQPGAITVTPEGLRIAYAPLQRR